MKGFNVLNAAMDQLFGSFDTPVIPEDKKLLWHAGPQWVSVLALMYTTKEADNRWYQKPILLETIKRLFDFYCYPDKYVEANKGKVYVTPEYQRRFPGFFIIALKLLEDDLQDVYADCLSRCHLIGEHFLEEIQRREDITFLTSANVGYGTNHLAVELYGLAEYLVNLHDEKPLAGLSLAYLRSYLKRVMDYATVSGFWVECDGPALVYNQLSAVTLMNTAMLLGVMDEYVDVFKQVAATQRKVVFDNLSLTDCLDGRNTDGEIDCYIGFLLLNPDCHDLYAAVLDYHAGRDKLPMNPDFVGPVCTGILLQKQYPLNENPVSAGDYYFEAPEGFSIKQTGPWKSALSNIRFRPRPEGHWNLDYQGLMSVYHSSFGRVFPGLNGKNDPWIGTFCISLDIFDNTPLDKPVMKYIPDEGYLESSANSQKVVRNYRGFQASLELSDFSDDHLKVTAEAITRKNEYPVYYNLVLPVRNGQTFSVNGKEYTLGEDKLNLKLSSSDKLLFHPEEIPDKVGHATPKDLTMHSNAEMELNWPHIPFNPYNTDDSIERNPKKFLCMLKIAIGYKQSVEIDINIQK